MVLDKKTTQTDEEFTPPAWLDSALIQKALENAGDTRQVVDLSVTRGTVPGDNYLGSMYRVKAILPHGEEVSFMVKGPIDDQTIADTAENTRVFQREGFMLAEVVPKMQALLEEAAPGRFPPFTARCPLRGDPPVDFLVMEDLAASGFKMAERKRGLGLRHSLLALRTLARFHAASHALLRREPELQQKLVSPWLVIDDEYVDYTTKNVQMVIDLLRPIDGYGEFVALVEKYKENATALITDMYKLKPGAFTVIVHDDFWVNNMMFRYENGMAEELRLVDLQGSSVNCAAEDLHYFFATSVSEDVSIRHEDLLVREYYFSLRETLELLGIEPPSFEKLLADMDLYGSHRFNSLISLMPYVKAEKAPDYSKAMAGDMSSIEPLHSNPSVLKWYKRSIPEYARKGWIPT